MLDIFRNEYMSGRRFLLSFLSMMFFLIYSSVSAEGAGDMPKLANPTPAIGTLPILIATLIKIIQMVVIPALVVLLIRSGFLIVTANGDEKKLIEGRSAFIWAVVGSAILLGAYVIAEMIQATMNLF